MTYYADSTNKFMCWNKVPDTKTSHYIIEMYPVRQIINTKNYTVIYDEHSKTYAYRIEDLGDRMDINAVTRIYTPKIPMPKNPSKNIKLDLLDRFIRQYDVKYTYLQVL